MLFLSRFLASALVAATLASAAPVLDEKLVEKRTTNTAADRSIWGDYSLSTNYYDTVPDTGVVREYYFTLVNTTLAPDGVERNVLTVNGTFPGPVITADWGDTVVVHLTNGLANNGTGLHFHGIRQNFTSQNDGVPSITQCPVAPGESITYIWRAAQYGSTWYHSHFALQAWEGILGGIVINGPASANYDNDIGILMLNDWSHETADALYPSAEAGGPPTLDNGLINGTNVYGTLGSRFEMTFTEGETHLIRLVNGAIDTHFKFMIDNHTFTVVTSDLVAIEPYTASVLNIGIGQRYDIIVNANQTASNYWLRAVPQVACSDNDNGDNIKGIVTYSTVSVADPTTDAYDYVDGCDDETANIVPYLALNAGAEDNEDDFDITVGQVGSVFKWFVSDTTFLSEWDNPSLLQVWNGNTSFTTQEHVISLPDANTWTYFVISTALGVTHPIHLHGHDFYVLAQDSGTYSDSTVLNTVNPPRRDVAMLPASGYLVLAFVTDNPGAWLMHCHIGWHTSEGFALQLVERQSEIAATVDIETLNSTCVAWDAYTASSGVEETDSGV